MWFKRIYCQLVSSLRQWCVELILIETYSKEIYSYLCFLPSKAKVRLAQISSNNLIFLFPLILFSFCIFRLPSPILPTYTPSPLVTTSLFSVSMGFLFSTYLLIIPTRWYSVKKARTCSHTIAAAVTTSGSCKEPQLASLKFTFWNFILRRLFLNVSSGQSCKSAKVKGSWHLS